MPLFLTKSPSSRRTLTCTKIFQQKVLEIENFGVSNYCENTRRARQKGESVEYRCWTGEGSPHPRSREYPGRLMIRWERSRYSRA